MKPVEGSFVWYELMTTDVEAARSFYARVVGWNVRDSGMPGMTYLIAGPGEERVAGIMAPPPEAANMPPRWVGYVMADDVDAKAQALQAAGGKVHRAPDDIPGVGRFAVVGDPQGAAFNLFKGADAPVDMPNPMATGSVGWNELNTSDWEKAFAFYAGLFGWSKGEAIAMGPMGTYQLFRTRAGENAVGGMMNAPAGGPPAWQFYFAVDDIDAAHGRIEEHGGAVLHGPQEVPGGAFIVNARDPQGAAFSVVGMRSGGSAAAG